MEEAIQLKAPCCGKQLRGVPLMYSATVNVRRLCCGRRWSVTIRPLVAHPFREVQIHQVDWSWCATAPATFEGWETTP